MNPLEPFEACRPLMFSIAYRMLGSAMAAEDIVQDAWLRYQGAPPDSIHSPKAFFGTIVTRLSINQLQLVRTQRETYIGPWLPEPVLTEDNPLLAPPAPSPMNHVELSESLSLAFLTLLEQLTPLERAIFLLREVFDFEYAEIAAIVEKEESACRQVLSRAKKHIAEQRPRFKATTEQHTRMLTQFTQAVGSSRLDDLIALLTEDVTLWADGGGRIRGAATRLIHGRQAVAQFVLNSTRFLSTEFQLDIAEVNGEPTAIIRQGALAVLVISLTPSHGGVSEIRVIGNPDKLGRV